MKFWIEIKHSYETYRYLVEHRPVDARTEQFVVTARNKTVAFTCNRPYYQSHPGLKKRRPVIRLTEGVIWNVAFTEKIVAAIAAWFPKVPVVYPPVGTK